MKIIKELIPYLIIILAVMLVRTFIVTPIMVRGDSMVPALDGNEIMLLKKYDTNYERFDIVVVDKIVEGDNLIKRVIGLPGETIKCRNNIVYIDGKPLDDEYASGTTSNFQEIKLDDDEYFVMGDNREVSLDSRDSKVGVIKKNEIEGTVGITLFPFNKIFK